MGAPRSFTPDIPEIEKPIRYLKGVGERLSDLFSRKEIHKVRDFLFFFPRTYEDRRTLVALSDLKPGMTCSVVGRVRSSHPVFYSRSGRRAFEAVLEDPRRERGLLKLTWFHGAYIKDKLKSGVWVMARGEVQQFQAQLQMVHPEVEILGKTFEEEELRLEGILPIYSETEGLYQRTIRKILQSTVKTYASQLEDPLPIEILEKHHWPSLSDALNQLHCPLKTADYDALVTGRSPAHQRMIYEEFFDLALGLGLKRQEYVEADGISFSKPQKTWDQLRANLAFQFTSAQRRVLKEILEDMTSSRVMHRLVQGDVGCGKTVVAAAAALVALESGYQVALMAPTELLVEQHYRNFQKWFAGMDIPMSLLTGSLSAKEKKLVLADLKQEGSRMVFGTHALFEDEVQFSKLGLVIVDEQHRFGVRQRARLVEKGQRPDVLVMIATPIPRTLALTLYGDLDISIIDELPAGRKPVTTRVFTDRQRDLLYDRVRSELKQGHQVYIVYPLIEDSEKLSLKSIETHLPMIQAAFQGYSVAHLHGKMTAEQKQSILDGFRRAEIPILVSTTVVEVGVDVPNATVMVIENAERFGLSQLHQLRGRIGRGSAESFCFLMASHLGSPEIVQRLKAMEKTHDGFKLSEVDLEMRGPGEFLGTRQSGLPVFQLAQLPRDLALLHEARNDAFAWIQKDPALERLPALKKRIDARAKSVPLN